MKKVAKVKERVLMGEKIFLLAWGIIGLSWLIWGRYLTTTHLPSWKRELAEILNGE
tara:strand:- start:1148 stop:1315 length:168 start_codon:yes stop_codon:yes gene_type:complete